MVDNATLYGIDKNKIGMLGNDGGAWIAAGVGMIMAEHNDGNLLKFNLLQVPMVCNLPLLAAPNTLSNQEKEF